jgi:P27 family predicted phage terminase small subunit
MRGRKPLPTITRLVQGNRGRRPLNQHEPQHGTIDPTTPGELTTDDFAAAEWARVIGTLSRGHITTVDRVSLSLYCLKYSQWRRLETEAAQHPFIVRSPNGYPIPNPAIGMANKVASLMLKTASELGITPSSRSRIAVAPFEESKGTAVDEFTAWQRKRRSGK